MQERADEQRRDAPELKVYILKVSRREDGRADGDHRVKDRVNIIELDQTDRRELEIHILLTFLLCVYFKRIVLN